MEYYEIVPVKRKNKFTKFLIGLIIILSLLIVIIFFLSKEKLYEFPKDEAYVIVKANKNNKTERWGNIIYREKVKNAKNNNQNILSGKEYIEQKDENEIFIEEVNNLEQETSIGLENETNIMEIMPNEEEKNNLVTSNVIEEEINKEENKTTFKRNLEEFEGKKLIAFTFDDGPNNETTNRLLDNLDKYNARVTFFVLGSRVNENAETLKRAYNMGNQIGSHTYSHKNLFKLENSQIMEEITTTNNEIKNIIGVAPTILRPPYGNINCEIKNMINMYTILWDLDTEDWKNKDANLIVEYILNNAHDGAIILLHDLYETSIDGALQAMEILEQEGYAFVTIDEMIELKSVELDKNISYHYFTD